jgi:hypothetical protein
VGTTQRFESDGLRWTTRRLFCYKEEYKRSMPGRIIGVSQDAMEIVRCVWRYKHVKTYQT